MEAYKDQSVKDITVMSGVSLSWCLYLNKLWACTGLGVARNKKPGCSLPLQSTELKESRLRTISALER